MAEGRRSIKRILIVDDNVFVREGMAAYFARRGYETVEAGDGAAALALAGDGGCQAAVVDIVIPEKEGQPADMGGSEGVRLARELKRAFPDLGVLVFSAFDDRGREVLELAASGMRGLAYLVKGAHPDKVLEALCEACEGKVVLAPEVLHYGPRMARELRNMLSPQESRWVREAVSRCKDLTPREMEVALLLAASRTTQGIAEALDISAKTVEKHTNHIYAKLNLSDVDKLDPPLRKALLLAKACWLDELQGSSER